MALTLATLRTQIVTIPSKYLEEDNHKRPVDRADDHACEEQMTTAAVVVRTEGKTHP